MRGTRTLSRTGSNCWESPRCPGCDHHGPELLPLLDSQVQLGGQAAAERPRPWSSGSMTMPPGGSFCRSPFSLPGRVLVGPDDGGVDVEVPGDQVLGAGPGLQLGKDPLPDTVSLPAAKQVVRGPRARTAPEHPAMASRFGSATVCRRSVVAGSISSAGLASCPWVTEAPATSTAHPSALLAPQSKIIACSRSAFDTRPSTHLCLFKVVPVMSWAHARLGLPRHSCVRPGDALTTATA